jgi:hypothetical protein
MCNHLVAQNLFLMESCIVAIVGAETYLRLRRIPTRVTLLMIGKGQRSFNLYFSRTKSSLPCTKDSLFSLLFSA